MSLLVSLNNALSSLNVNKQALTVLSQNIANANTPGYARKVVSQSAAYNLDGTAAGVQIDEISRRVDLLLRASVQTQNSSVGETKALSDYADRIQILLGQPGAANSLDSYINDFFSDLQTLAETPETGSLKLSAVNAGARLANNISDLARNLQDLRFQADQMISQGVSKVNQNLKELKTLNVALANTYNLGTPQSELLDRRDALLRDTASYLNINTYFKVSGEVQISAGSGGDALLDGELYQLFYSPQPSIDALVEGGPISPITLSLVNERGVAFGQVLEFVGGSNGGPVTNTLTAGSFSAYMALRDTKIPNILQQLDTLASTLRDSFNTLHNSGSGYPGSNSITGTRLVNGQDSMQWQGKVMVAMLDSKGHPLANPYGESDGLRPLTLDLAHLDTGGGEGQPTVQGIINEINSYYNQPQSKASLGNLNNIRLRSDSTSLPGVPAQFKFDFDLENISAQNANFFVSNVTIKNDAGTDITSTTDTLPSISLSSTATYTTTTGSPTVTVKCDTSGLHNGDYVYLSTPPGAVNGIPAASLSGYFIIGNVTANGFDITALDVATADGAVNVASQTAKPAYQTVEPGEQARAKENGIITASLTGQTSSQFYTVTVDVAVADEDGNLDTGTITYKIMNGSYNLLNQPFSAYSVGGEAVLKGSQYTAPLMTATLVDANGVELPKTNGVYTSFEDGYLKLTSSSSAYNIAINSLDSKEVGYPNENPARAGTNRGFSHYFELNNFFNSNISTSTGDTLKGSAIALSVTDRLKQNPNLLTTGQLSRVPRPADPTLPDYYTYEYLLGDNSIIQGLAGLASSKLDFGAAGGLGATTVDLNSYAGSIIGFVSADANAAKGNKQSAQTLLDGFEQRDSSDSGVNIDEEVANLTVYQNAYSASARIITTVNTLFEDLIGILR